MSRVLPILFNTDMVQAILDGRKTVTRRLVKFLPEEPELDRICKRWINAINEPCCRKLPYSVGDILYVRETYCPNYFDFVTQYGNKHGYKSDYEKAILSSDIPKPKWVPSIHMPKEAARIWLKVKDVRVEKLQDITNEQIIKEGISKDTVVHYLSQFAEREEWERAVHLIPFTELWNDTIKKQDIGFYDWDANPWVWVIEFERCEKPEDN